MAQYTTNYNLYRPSRNDNDIEVDTSLDNNFQIIDAEIKNRANEINAVNTEVTNARVDSINNVTHPTLKDRLDSHANEIGILNKRTSGYVSVLEFGADPTGSTESTQAFNDAMQYAYTNKLKVKVPRGVYLVKRLTPPKYTVLEGEGGGSQHPQQWDKVTVLKLMDGTNDHMFYGGDGEEYVTLRDLHLIGNKGAQTTAGCGVYLVDAAAQEAQWRLERVVIRDFKGDGVYLGNNRRATRIIDCNIYGNDGYGVRITGTDNIITTSLIHNNALDGIAINSAVNKVISCEVFRNQAGINLMSSCQHTSVIGCGIDKNQRQGVLIDGFNNMIISNTIRSNGIETDNTYSHIEVKRSRNAIIGNVFAHEDTVSSNMAKYCIGIIGSLTDIYVFGNMPDLIVGSSRSGFINKPEIAIGYINNSISSTPGYIGQIAVVNGIAYISTGTSSPSDWKQITN
jgi:Pectate lyase superfamily protein